MTLRPFAIKWLPDTQGVYVIPMTNCQNCVTGNELARWPDGLVAQWLQLQLQLHTGISAYEVRHAGLIAMQLQLAVANKKLNSIKPAQNGAQWLRIIGFFVTLLWISFLIF